MRQKLDSRGFTLLELMVVLTILALLSATYLYSTYGKERTTKVQATANQVSELVKAANAWREMQGSAMFTGISITNLVNSGLYPTSTNPFGGSIAVSSVNSNRSVRVGQFNLDTTSADNLVSIFTAWGGSNVTKAGTGPYNVSADF